MFFGYTTKLKQYDTPMIAQPFIIQKMVFDIKPGYKDEEVKQFLILFNDVIKLYYGFIDRVTAKNQEGQYIDLIYWSDIEAAKEAEEDFKRSLQVTSIFNIINSASVAIYYYDVFNQLEG